MGIKNKKNRVNELEFRGRLEDCVLLVKHPLNETIHPWWPAGMFYVGIDYFDEEGNTTGACKSLFEFVSNCLDTILYHDGECLLMGVGHIDEFPDCPVSLFKNYCTVDWRCWS